MNWSTFCAQWNYDSAYGEFQPALIRYLELEGKIDQDTVARIFRIARQEGHSKGYGEVLERAAYMYWVVTGEYLN